MQNYTVVTECTAITEYTVTAKSKEHATELVAEGTFDTEKITDYMNEDVIAVEQNSNVIVKR